MKINSLSEGFAGWSIFGYRKPFLLVNLRLSKPSDQQDALPLIQSAIAAKIKRVEIGLRKTEQAIQRFEAKYRISSDQFLDGYTADDLEGGDEDYVSWMGELKLRQAIWEELHLLQNIEYVTHRVSC